MFFKKKLWRSYVWTEGINPYSSLQGLHCFAGAPLTVLNHMWNTGCFQLSFLFNYQVPILGDSLQSWRCIVLFGMNIWQGRVNQLPREHHLQHFKTPSHHECLIGSLSFFTAFSALNLRWSLQVGIKKRGTWGGWVMGRMLEEMVVADFDALSLWLL